MMSSTQNTPNQMPMPQFIDTYLSDWQKYGFPELWSTAGSKIQNLPNGLVFWRRRLQLVVVPSGELGG
jgi:hypothetical protein